MVRCHWGTALLSDYGTIVTQSLETMDCQSFIDGRPVQTWTDEVFDFTNIRQMLAEILDWTLIFNVRAVAGSSGD